MRKLSCGVVRLQSSGFSPAVIDSLEAVCDEVQSHLYRGSLMQERVETCPAEEGRGKNSDGFPPRHCKCI